jgi:hypothetical protein
VVRAGLAEGDDVALGQNRDLEPAEPYALVLGERLEQRVEEDRIDAATLPQRGFGLVVGSPWVRLSLHFVSLVS